MKWISVYDKFPTTNPDKRVKYLCYGHDETFVTEWRGYSYGPGFDQYHGPIEYWMPLPAPPK